MKIYAYQVPPDMQDNQVFLDDVKEGYVYPDIAIFGNRNCPDIGNEDILRLVHEADNACVARGEGIADYLSMKTGRPYRYHLLTGSSQSEWNYLYYPTDDPMWTDQALADFSIRYWNEGTQWMVGTSFLFVKTGEGQYADLWVYCTHDPEYEPDVLRKELCLVFGRGLPQDYVIKRFMGYVKVPQYEAV
jgi:hypothetical protein